jgi:hypothetical protein
MLLHVLLRQPSTNLHQRPFRERTLLPPGSARPIPLERLRSLPNPLRGEVVEHDNVRSGGDRFPRFGERLTFDVDAEGETGGGLCGVDGLGDGACFSWIDR